MKTPWHTMPRVLPTDGEEVWVRPAYQLSVPYLAVWSLAGQYFVTTTYGLIIPWMLVAAWKHK